MADKFPVFSDKHKDYDTVDGSSNFGRFMIWLGSNDDTWLNEINIKLETL